jgi:purine-nucleoside phosphorylase
LKKKKFLNKKGRSDNVATAHIESREDDIAKIVLMPGDPKRAKYIADYYLKNVKLVNQVRGMMAYTGYYQDKKITIFPSGMGIPSIGIYSYELFQNYNVDCIIRIGTMGAYEPTLQLGDLVVVDRAYSNSSFAKAQSNYTRNFLDSNLDLTQTIVDTANQLNLSFARGNIFTSDVFYEGKETAKDRFRDYHALGVEMETFGLFQTAKLCDKKAATILTVANSFCFEDELTSEEREKKLDNMIRLALNVSLKL